MDSTDTFRFFPAATWAHTNISASCTRRNSRMSFAFFYAFGTFGRADALALELTTFIIKMLGIPPT